MNARRRRSRRQIPGSDLWEKVVAFADRGERFRDSFDYIERMWETAPAFENAYGSPHGGMDMLPKPTSGKLPLLITGGSQQDPG